MSFDRQAILEQKVNVLMQECNSALTEMGRMLVNIVETHRAFTIYIDTKLGEINERLAEVEKKAGITSSNESSGQSELGERKEGIEL
jgi:hypothetical protein